MVTGGSGMSAPGDAPASAPANGTQGPRPKYVASHGSIELRLTRSKYFGYDLGGLSSQTNMDAICEAEYPSNPPAVLYSKLCDTNPSSGDPLLDAYPETWAWTAFDFRRHDGVGSCLSYKESSVEVQQRAASTIARRGETKIAPCAESYPVACCLHK